MSVPMSGAISAVQVQAVFSEAVAFHQRGQLDQARARYEFILKAQPGHYPSLHLLGVLAAQTKNFQLAVELIGIAIDIYPLDPNFHFNLGNAQKELGQVDAAIASYERAIALQASHAEAHCNRGVALQDLRQWDAAVASFGRAIAIQPNYAKAYVNRGVALHALKQLDAAIVDFDQALVIQPGYVKAHTNRGVALHALRQLDAALACYEQAIAIEPNYAEANFYKSLVLLLRGEFEQGWDLYQWLWKTEKSAPKLRHFTQPAWSGVESLSGKTILVHNEQGLGDMIQFCRYIRMFADSGARVVLEVPAPLMGLLHGLDGVSEWVVNGAALPTFDFHCFLLALPRVFGTRISTIPAKQPYLHSDPNKVAQWTARLGGKTKPRIGLVWSGSVEHAIDYNRSIALSTLASTLPGGCEYVSLQKEVRDSDGLALKRHENIRHFGDEIRDFSDTAALCELMDVVVSVDTSVAHLSGALGRPTWVLLPFVPDWRWLLDRDDSPWYASVRLYRQASDGDWGGVLGRVQADLTGLRV